MKRLGQVVYLLALGLAVDPATAGKAMAQGTALPTIKVDLPPSPNFQVTNAPEQYPDGTMSVYGVRKKMGTYLDKDVEIKAYLIEVYECPPELRKCNDELAAKTKKDKKKGKGLPGGPAAAEPTPELKGSCRPCDQPHFYLSDTPNGKKERALLIADYPIKDWNTGKPKPLTAPLGQQYIVTGTFAINSIGGFAASDGLIIHKKTRDMNQAILLEGNAVLPPEAQDIRLEGRAAEKVGGIRMDANLPSGGDAQAKTPKKGLPKEF